jgi:hypothetical protein
MVLAFQERVAKLRPSEAKVAAFVGLRPHIAAEMTLSELASGAGVSEPTVLRFCRAVGCGSFQEFKRGLLLDLDRRGPGRNGLLALRTAASGEDAFDLAARTLTSASRVVVVGGPGLLQVARDVAARLRSFGVDARARSGALGQRLVHARTVVWHLHPLKELGDGSAEGAGSIIAMRAGSEAAEAPPTGSMIVVPVPTSSADVCDSLCVVEAALGVLLRVSEVAKRLQSLPTPIGGVVA